MHQEMSNNVYASAYMVDIVKIRMIHVICLRGCAALCVPGFTSFVYFSDVRTWDHLMSGISAPNLF